MAGKPDMKALAAENAKRSLKKRRRCPSCRMVKKFDDFGFRKIMVKDGYVERIQTWCKQCRREAARESLKRKKEKQNGRV